MKNIIPLSLALMAFYSVLTSAATTAVTPDYAENLIIVKFSVIAGRIDLGAFKSNHIRARLWLFPLPCRI